MTVKALVSQTDVPSGRDFLGDRNKKMDVVSLYDKTGLSVQPWVWGQFQVGFRGAGGPTTQHAVVGSEDLDTPSTSSQPARGLLWFARPLLASIYYILSLTHCDDIYPPLTAITLDTYMGVSAMDDTQGVSIDAKSLNPSIRRGK